MSDLFRKEAIENRSRALYGEVILKGPLSTWILTVIIILTALIGIGLLLGLSVQTENREVSLLTWLLNGA